MTSGVVAVAFCAGGHVVFSANLHISGDSYRIHNECEKSMTSNKVWASSFPGKYK